MENEIGKRINYFLWRYAIMPLWQSKKNLVFFRSAKYAGIVSVFCFTILQEKREMWNR